MRSPDAPPYVDPDASVAMMAEDRMAENRMTEDRITKNRMTENRMTHDGTAG